MVQNHVEKVDRRLLVERVVVSHTGADIQLRVEGLTSLVRDLGTTGAPMAGVAA